jgi:nucleoid-associated protein YgaU
LGFDAQRYFPPEEPKENLVIRSALVIVGLAAALMLTACQKPQAKPEAHVENTPIPALDQSERTPVQPLDAYNAPPPRQMDPEPAFTPPPKPVTIKPADKSVKPAHGKTYVVQKGDTLSSISKKFYNTQNRWKDIYDANKARVKDPNKLQVGTKLIIP